MNDLAISYTENLRHISSIFGGHSLALARKSGQRVGGELADPAFSFLFNACFAMLVRFRTLFSLFDSCVPLFIG